MRLRYYELKLQTCMKDGFCFEFPPPPAVLFSVLSKFSSSPFCKMGLNLAVRVQLFGMSKSPLDSLPLLDSLFYFLSLSFPTTIKVEGLVSKVEKSSGRLGLCCYPTSWHFAFTSFFAFGFLTFLPFQYVFMRFHF